MYGITDHYFQTLHDFNTFGERLEAFLPEQALQGESSSRISCQRPRSCPRQAGRLRFSWASQVSESGSNRFPTTTLSQAMLFALQCLRHNYRIFSLVVCSI